MKLGIEIFLENKKMIQLLKGQKIGLICHPASVDQSLQHSLDLLSRKVKVSCAFGPQHGVRGDKQDNMIESPNFQDPILKIPIYSLYGEVRRPTHEMMKNFDVMIFDLQDLGCRIYTFITTLLYCMEECAKTHKKMIILDRPNPAGRPIEGFRMLKGWESFVGAAPIPMRHGLTVAELAQYFKEHYQMNLDLQIVKMKGYNPEKPMGWGWDQKRSWINPSPNAATLNMARAYSGTVLIEGTTLSEGRGTTRALEVIGASDIDFAEVLKRMRKLAPAWHKGVVLRECFFEPTFHKHMGKLCHGFQFHTDLEGYKHDQFRPFRLVALMLKVIRQMHPKYPIYRDFAYEYVKDRLAFDVINGGPALKSWIEDNRSTPSQLDQALKIDETSWKKERQKFLLY